MSHTPSRKQFTDDQIDRGTAIIVKAQLASVSLLQRHLHTGYQATKDLMAALSEAGVVTASVDGQMQLAPAYREGDEAFKKFALSRFSGCDGGDPGTDSPSVWIWGVEHGSPAAAPPDTGDEEYGIEDTQLHFRFNCDVFKLLAAMHGESARDFKEFARKHQPFVRGSRGYFKGNLYPYPCHKVSAAAWNEQAREQTGFASKERYLDWCRSHRLPEVARWVSEFRPRLVIACGVMHRDEYLGVFFNWEPVTLQTCDFMVDGASKRFYFARHDGRLLVVVPHFEVYCQ